MVIMSAKVSKRKVLTGLIVAVAVVVLLAVLLGKAGEAPAASVQESAAAEIDAGSNEGRVAFLQSFGWEVAETPVETQEVKIPVEFNNVFTRYNQLQQSQGYDLSQYTPAIILLTDGVSDGSFFDFRDGYEVFGADVPVFSIMFGSADPTQLEELAELTHARVFDGREDLIGAFRSVKGYN